MSETGSAGCLIYGATGFTGRLVLDEARRRGLAPILGGRDRASLEALAASIGGAEIRVAEATDRRALQRAMEGIDVVVSCVGPFMRYGERVLRAAIEAGANYLDTTGEQDFMARVMDGLGGRAEERGVTAVVAHAFEYAIGDCAARIAADETPGVETLEVFNRVEGFGATRGTKKSALHALSVPALALVNGRRRPELPGAHLARVRFPDEDRDRLGVSFGGGEVLSAPGYAATVRNVRTYLVASDWLARGAPWIGRLGPVLSRGPLLRWIERRIDAGRVGPGEDRQDQPWWVLARARAPGGRGTRVTASGYDSYGITAVIVVTGVQWLLEGRAERPGVATTAQAFAPRAFLDALAPAGVAWRIDPLEGSAR